MFCFYLQFDVKNQRIFLRRIRTDNLHPEDLFVGNRVNVFSRQLNLIDYGDQYTANKLGSKKERCDCVVHVKNLHDPPQSHASLLLITSQIIPATVAHDLYFNVIFREVLSVCVGLYTRTHCACPQYG